MSSLIKLQKRNDTLVLVCDCREEVMVIDYDKDHGIADFCMYKRYNSYSKNRSFLNKIKAIWNLLVKNDQYNDQMVLNQEQIKEIYYFLENKF